ncbi:hypothetical protein PENTCL1PPCAC_22753 [Pristionchus entomophagus]|uniref:Uncharacterized protein n=1 Tax=Pristionchus entomophagus TaxID=358040 RepID=A0AAV5U320_9BILA|nr:hypothetical protein PENTCL1PPCAC_22753 [Pristionchus entomophagus]
MGSQYYRDDSMSSGSFQTSTSFYQGFSQPPGLNQPGFWNQPGSLPSKAQPPSKGAIKTPGSEMRRSRVQIKPKTPAQILNELYQISDTYDNDGMMFKCNLSVAGQAFHAVSSSKKNAKHEACLVALKSLRPDVLAEMENHGAPATNFSTNQFDAPVKKRKVESVDSCCTLKDLLSTLCLEGNKKYKMDSTDVTEVGGDAKNRKFSAVLTFADEGKMYTHTAEGTSVANTMVIRQALKDVFNQSEDDIIKVIKRGHLKKLHNMQSFSALNMMCSTSLYSIVSVDFEEVPEGKNMFFICYITIKNCDGVEVQMKGPKCKSKAQAKERTAAVALENIFQIHPATLEAVENDQSTTAVSQLFEMGSRQKPVLRPEFIDMGEEMNGTIKYFKFKCVIGGREFLGSGRSKKDAKNEAANIALMNIFHMNVVVKREGDGKGEDGGDESSVYDATCAYVKSQYEQMCKFYGMAPSSDFTCFVLLNENNEKKLISIGSSPQSTTPLGRVAESGGKTLIHHDSVVYARRAAIRFLITQLAKAQDGQEDTCLERAEMSENFQLKTSLRLAIVTSQPIDIRFSAPESTVKKLSVYGQCNLLECVADEKEEPRVHSVADKIFKWCHLGVQGSLLTNRINPIIPCSILTMTRCPLTDISYLKSFTSRICSPPFPIAIHSSKMDIDPSPSPAHLWSRAESKLERLSHYTGLTCDGDESCCSKYQLYKAFLEVTPRFPKAIPYNEAKKMAGGYVSSKELFFHEMTKAGLGKWNGVGGLGDRFVIG